jgi:hypothetical protein
MKGVAMSAGRHWAKEIYVGFLLLILSFLYLSHLTTEFRKAELNDELKRMKASTRPFAAALGKERASSISKFL